jgi:hypothetical protein
LVDPERVCQVAKRIVMSCDPFISAWEFEHNVDGEALFDELLDALGLTREERRRLQDEGGH